VHVLNAKRKSFLEKYIKFGIVGAGGALINWGVLYLLTNYARVWYMYSEIIATFIAFTFNFYLNYRWTFGERRKVEPS